MPAGASLRWSAGCWPEVERQRLKLIKNGAPPAGPRGGAWGALPRRLQGRGCKHAVAWAPLPALCPDWLPLNPQRKPRGSLATPQASTNRISQRVLFLYPQPVPIVTPYPSNRPALSRMRSQGGP